MSEPLTTTQGKALKVPYLKRSGKYTHKEYHKQFKVQASFVDKLPWVEFLDDKKIMVLEDGRSIGAFFELTTVGTEGRTDAFLQQIRDQVCYALQDSFLEKDTNPYVVQFYCQDDEEAGEYGRYLEQYISERVKPNAFSDEWLRIMKKHLKDVAKPDGLFEDKTVSGTQWRGQIRKTRMVIYRYIAKGKKLEPFAHSIEELETTIENISNALFSAGIKSKQLSGEEVHGWLLRWFNPNPDLFDDVDEFYRTLSYVPRNVGDGELPIPFSDFSENLLVKGVRSDKGRWYFDEKPHSIIMIDNLRYAPLKGIITGEIERGGNINALFDLMPKDTKMVLTMVVYPQDQFENHLQHIYNSAIGDNVESTYTKEDCLTVRQYLKDGHKLYLSSLGFFVSGENESDLIRKERKIRTTLQAVGLVCVQENCEVAPLSSYLRWLPMNFNPNDDKKRLYTKFNFVQHITNLLPIFGRSLGTRNPGITYFNRGGAPLDFDPMNKEDRAKTAHLLLLGPTGAGKSATLNAKIAQLMATYRPRLFIIEAGNSFGLIAQYAKRYGLTVNHLQLKPKSGVTLPMFRDADKIDFNELSEHESLVNSDEKIIDEIDESLEDDQRDILGEMEMIARLMITGGKISEDERMTRADEALIRKAIVMAAKKCKALGKITLTEDIRDAFFVMSKDESLPSPRRLRSYEMGESIGLFCQKGSFDAELFNSVGEIWQDADITLVDLATLAREGYEVQLAIAYISLINHINSLGEQHQFSGRAIVNITDEAHIITVNPMLAKFLAKAGKMWRKLGIWLWLATQNLADFPNTAQKLLSMIEWWELLCLDKSETEQVTHFKDLTAEQRQLITSARKEDRKYTEGVVLSTKTELLFRVVPPSIYLAMAMTDAEEKAERAQLMREHNISELDAALMVAKRIDRARGIAC